MGFARHLIHYYSVETEKVLSFLLAIGMLLNFFQLGQ